MSVLKRIVASPAFLSAAGSVAAWYLRLVWYASRRTIEPATIYDTVQMPAIIAMWHGQHFLSPFIPRPLPIRCKGLSVAGFLLRLRDRNIRPPH